MKYKLIIFDLDGTILATGGDLCLAVNRALRKYGLPCHDEKTVLSFVGNGAYKLIERAVGGADVDVNAVLEDYKQFYLEDCTTTTRPYSGIPELLRDLRDCGVIVACNTNKPEAPAHKVLARYLPGLIDFIQPQIDGVPRKPDPEGALKIIDHFGVDLSECIYVGDSDVDIRTAANAGIDVISVSWGFKTHEFLARTGAGKIADSVDELRALFGINDDAASNSVKSSD